MISTEQVKELRDQTGVSIMQCKKALEEAAGDQEKALLILKQKSGDVAEKKAGRQTNSGTVAIEQGDGKVAVVVLRCETDFVAKNDNFQSFARDLAQTALSEGAQAAETQAENELPEMVQKIGENMQIDTIEVLEGSVIGAYEHHGQQGAVVLLSGGDEKLARDIAMHIAAMKPQYKSQDDIPAEAIEKMKEIFADEVADMEKPEEVKEKIIQGKVSTYFNEQTLTTQKFVKDQEKTINDLLTQAGVHVEDFRVYNK